MTLEKIIQDGRLLSVLKENKIDIDIELLERLEIAIDGSAKEIIETFGGDHNDIETMKLAITDTESEVLNAIIVAMFMNCPKYHIADQPKEFEIFEKGVRIYE